MKHWRINIACFLTELAITICPDIKGVMFTIGSEDLSKRAKAKMDEENQDLNKIMKDYFEQKARDEKAN